MREDGRGAERDDGEFDVRGVEETVQREGVREEVRVEQRGYRAAGTVSREDDVDVARVAAERGFEVWADFGGEFTG